MSQQRILLLEDDETLSETLKDLLQGNGYEVDLANNGEEAVNLAFDNSYSLYIFDINVPEIDGFELLKELRRADDNTPTIFISAMTDLKSMSKGFELGADDYIKKPFFPQELLLRVNAKMVKNTKEILYNNLRYNPNTKELFRNDIRINLSHMLSEMFHLLISAKGKVIDKDELLECMESPSPTALRVAITKLKQLTSADIKNIRGVGYTLE